MGFLKNILTCLAILSPILSSSSTKYLKTLVLPISFLSNLGRQIPPVCGGVSLTGLLFDNPNNFNTVISESSNNTVSLSKDKVTVLNMNNNRYASSLGCIIDSYYNEARNYYNSFSSLPNFDSYDIKIFILPSSAGGGSCARKTFYSTNTYSFIRKCDLPTLTKAIFSSFGLSNAEIANVENYENGDLSDPMGIGTYTKVMLLNPLNRFKLGWILKESITQYNTTNIHTISSASQKYPFYPIMIKGPKTNDIQLEYFWISYRGNSTATSDIYLPNNYINCVFIHNTNLLQKKLCIPGEEFINSGSNTRIVLRSKSNNLSRIEFLYCIQKLPTLKINSYKDTMTLSIFNNNNKNCNFTTSYKVVFKHMPIGYNIDSLNNSSRRISVRLVLDINPLEVSFEFSGKSGILFSRPMMSLTSGIYSFIYTGNLGSIITFKIFDHGGDGICCQYGGGSYYEILIGDTVIHIGGAFGFVDIFEFSNNPVIILKDIYPQQSIISKNLTLFKPNKFQNTITLTVSSLNSKVGYGITLLPYYNFSTIL